MVANHTFYVYEIFTAYHHATETDCLLLLVLCHGHGTECFWITLSNLVSAIDVHQLPKSEATRHLSFDVYMLCWFDGRCRMPFDLKTPIGYLMAFALTYVMLKHVYVFASAALSFEIGCYLWVMEFIKDIKNHTNSLNATAKSRRKRWQTMERLRDSIEFHSHIKQLSIRFFDSRLSSDFNFQQFRLVRDMSNIGQPMLTALFSWSLVTNCGTLLIVQMQLVQWIEFYLVHLVQIKRKIFFIFRPYSSPASQLI